MKTIIKRFWNYIRIKSAIKQADKMKELCRKQHFVIKIHNKIRVYDRAHINFLIHQGILHKRLRDAIELKKICIYYTK